MIICHTLPVQLASTSPKSTLNSHSLQAPQIHRPNRSSSHYPNNQINLTGSSELCQAVPKYLSLQFRSFQPKPVNIYDPTGDHSHLQLRISRSRNRFPKFLTQKFFCNPLFDFYRCSVCQSLTLIFLLEQFCSVDVYLPNLLSALSSERWWSVLTSPALRSTLTSSIFAWKSVHMHIIYSVSWLSTVSFYTFLPLSSCVHLSLRIKYVLHTSTSLSKQISVT